MDLDMLEAAGVRTVANLLALAEALSVPPHALLNEMATPSPSAPQE